MNYLQRKKLALMMNRKFKGYLRTVSGVPLTLTDCMGSELMSLSVTGSADGVGERTANLFDVNGDINRRADDSIIVPNIHINVLVEGDKINIHCSGSSYYGVGQWISVEIGKTYTYSYTLLNIGEAGGVYAQAMYPDTWTAIAIATVRQEGENGIASFTAEQDKVMFCFNKTVGSPAYDTGTIIGNIMFVEGEYTAETLPEYEPYGYKIPLTVSGRNLFDTKTAKKNSGAVSLLEVTDNSLTVGQPWAGLWASVNVLISEELIGKTITVSADISTSGANKGGIRIMWLNGALGVTDLGYIISSYVSSSTPQRISMTGVVPENTTENEYKLCLMFYSNVNATLESGVEYTATYSNIQIELGDTATAYEPYCTPETYNIYSDTPLYGTEGEEYTVPAITTFKGTTIIMPETSVQPTSMTAEYYARKP